MIVKFGTDGVRGVANVELTPEIAFALGRAGSRVLGKPDKKTVIVIGRDTRISGPMLEAAFNAGACSAGADVISLGVMPTPGVAYLTGKYAADFGVVISASHNPAADNGIKFFGPHGYKLPDEAEREIERILAQELDQIPRGSGSDVGRILTADSAVDDYIEFLCSCYDPVSAQCPLRIVVDCAHGAASDIAPRLWQKTGLVVKFINCQPDGININDHCGSTHTQMLMDTVREQSADLGVAYDGDSDRCIFVDENGQELDGDYILGIFALYLQERPLEPARVVGTVMSNIGLELLLQQHNIEFISAPVGDRYVLENMNSSGAVIGGEQSGHIILSRYADTGDGLLTSLKMVEILQKQGQSFSKLASVLQKKPQMLVNVRVADKDTVLDSPVMQEALTAAHARLGAEGKIVLRPSGTEPVVRLMAQGNDPVLIADILLQLENVLQQI